MSSEQNRAAEQMTGSLSCFLTPISAPAKTVSNKTLLIFNNLHRFAPPPVSYLFPDKLYQKHSATPKRSRWI